jgi:hypothetical protein
MELDMSARTSDRVSSIAARYAKITSQELLARTATDFMREATAADIRSMAASLLRQDDHKGLRGLIRKVAGR